MYMTSDPIESESDDELPLTELNIHDPERVAWRNEHFEVLSELYKQFCTQGETVFGRAFFQFGSFTQFIEFLYEHTYTPSKVLLKPKGGAYNVGNLASGSRCERGLHVHEA
jgi:hypothetical protein